MSAGSPGRIRNANRRDLEAIVGIETRAFEPARRSSRASLRRALSSPFQRVLVLEEGAAGEAPALLGYVILWPFRRTWRIYNIAADPHRHNQGVGSALLVAAIERAREAGAERIVLEARPEPALMRFYERHGFRRAAGLDDYYAPGEHAVRLERTLPEERAR